MQCQFRLTDVTPAIKSNVVSNFTHFPVNQTVFIHRGHNTRCRYLYAVLPSYNAVRVHDSYSGHYDT
jgi:hypothetical protein